MPTTRITSNGSVTLPAKFRKALGLLPGDIVSAELRHGAIVMKPAKVVDAEDAWFYTQEWQKKEAEADADIAAGRVKGPFKNADEMIRSLKGKSSRKK